MVKDQEFEIDGLRIVGRVWGNQGPKIIALHGWLDNAASFDAVAARLPDTQFLALDLPGHGFSAHKPPSGSYAIWDDLRTVLGVADCLGWEQFHLLGHSRGAMMANLLASAVPERVTSLICVDGLAAPPVSEADFPKQLGNYLREYGAEAGAVRAFASLEEAAKARIKAMPMQLTSALKIVERGTYQDEQGEFRWRSDRRVSLASPAKLTEAQWQAVVKPQMPALFISASDGFGQRIRSMYPQIDQYFDLAEIQGGHHCHMDVGADAVAEKIWEFIQKTK